VKKGTVIFLLFSLLAPVLISYVWLSIERLAYRWEIQQSIRSGRLFRSGKPVLLVFTKRESMEKLRWEHPGEFEYQGRMYDILETEERGDTLFYRCFLDQRETSLNQQIRKVIAKFIGNPVKNNENQKRLGNFFHLGFLPAFSSWKVDHGNRDHAYAPHALNLYLSRSLKPPVPPPRVS